MTSAGAVAAIDCWLHLLGTDVTNRIAKVLVTHRRTGKVAKLNTLNIPLSESRCEWKPLICLSNVLQARQFLERPYRISVSDQ